MTDLDFFKEADSSELYLNEMLDTSQQFSKSDL